MQKINICPQMLREELKKVKEWVEQREEEELKRWVHRIKIDI